MKLWIVSDIHLEFGEPFLQTPPNGVDVIVCAGDVAIKGIVNGLRWLAKGFAQQIPVVVVAGNHDFYSTAIEEGIRDAREYASHLPNLHFLENDACEIDGVRFVGGTLWTDFRLYGRNPTVAMSFAGSGMNDFKKIKLSKRPFRKFRPLDAYQKHVETRNFIYAELRENAGTKTTVVVTHHAPSPHSLGLGFRHDPLSACYASDMEDLLREVGPRLWVHGHVHHRNDYLVSDTRIVSNARGYPQEETGFDPNLVVEVTPNPGPRGEIVDAALSILDRAPDADPDPGDEL